MVNIQVGNHLLENIELMIFDKDGTIIDLYQYWSRMVYFRSLFICQRTGIDISHLNRLGYVMGVDWEAGRLRPEGPVGLKKREVVMREAINYLEGLGLSQVDELCSQVFKDVDDFSLTRLYDFIKPIDGSVELIKQLFTKGCKVAIATTDLSSRAYVAMKHLGLENHINLIIGAEMVKKPKPDPEQIELALARLSVSRERTIMVGDAATDVEMGINAGVRGAIGLLTGFGTYEEFRRMTPYIVPDISHIKVA